MSQDYRVALIARSNRTIDIPVPERFWALWLVEFPIWLNELGLTALLIESRLNVLDRAARALDLYESFSEVERAPYANAFRFVDFDAVRAEIAELQADPTGRIACIP